MIISKAYNVMIIKMKDKKILLNLLDLLTFRKLLHSSYSSYTKWRAHPFEGC